ncbi:MAG TPA: murein biosynthesis integral membrane protein MurJ [Rariglobus sp.]|nr:murein biosynthesis integral membrane protein MurJ [Rariglobus sp.]
MSKKLRNIGVISLLTVISRILGLVRDQLSAAIFGTSMFNDAFVTAFSLPNLFRRLLGEGSLTAAFVPMLQQELHENGRPGAFDLLSKVVSRLLVATGGLSLVAMLLFSEARLITGLEERWYLAAHLTVLLFPYLAFVCVAAAFNATLNVFQRFTEPALSPIWLNLAMILSLGGAGLRFAHSPLGEMYWLCAGVLIGGFLQMIVPAVVLMRDGWRPKFDLGPSQRVKEIIALMAPGLFGTAIYQINILVSRMLAFSLTVSAATMMFYANRLMELPIGVFAIAVSTVVYPLIAKHAVERKFAEMADDYRKGVRLILAINVPAAVGLALLSEPIVRLLFQRGQFTADDTLMMAPLLTLFAVGMPFFSVVNLTVRAFYAVKDTMTPVKVGVVDFAVNVGLSLILREWLGVMGLVLASTLAIVVQMVLLQRSLVRRLPGMTLTPLWPSIAKVLAGSLVMGVTVWAGWHWLHDWPVVVSIGRVTLHGADLVAVFGLIPAGVLAYAVVLWALRIEGRDEFRALLRRKRKTS